MDECSIWELSEIVDNIPYLDRNIWETARLNAYVVAQVNSRKHLTQQDICKFKWEDDKENPLEEHNYEISNEDIERLTKLSKQFEKHGKE
jgi:hypothetical protein